MYIYIYVYIYIYIYVYVYICIFDSLTNLIKDGGGLRALARRAPPARRRARGPVGCNTI